MRRRSCAHLRPLGDRRFRLAYLLEPRDNIGAAVEQPLAGVEGTGAVARGLPAFERQHVDADCLRRFARTAEVADDLIKWLGCCYCCHSAGYFGGTQATPRRRSAGKVGLAT